MIVQHKARKNNYVACVECKSKGVLAPATCLVGSEVLPERPLCNECKGEVQAGVSNVPSAGL
jgi:hypothetical protein